MHHLAVMSREGGSIERIVSGYKTIESRWYVNRISPYNKISKGDQIYFKYVGGEVIAKASTNRVIQFNNLTLAKIGKILQKYGEKIDTINYDYNTWGRRKNYCILIFLINPCWISQPFKICKTGFGMASAWISINNILDIKQK